jgi:hypothetical protein
MTNKIIIRRILPVIVLLNGLNSHAQIDLRITTYPRIENLSKGSIIKVTVRYINQTKKNYILFYSKVLPYKKPSEFYIDTLIPPTTIAIFTDSQGQLVKPRVQFKYYQAEFTDFEVQKRFEKTQEKLFSLQDSLKKIQIKETERIQFLLPSDNFKDIEYLISTKDYLLHPGFFNLQIAYECESVLCFEKSVRDKIKSQYKDAEIYFGKIQSQLVKIKISDSRPNKK